MATEYHIPRDVTVWLCRECCNATTTPREDDYSNDYFCPACYEKLSVENTSERQVYWVSIAAYTTGRSYGGPEEGGWYYDTGDRIDESLRCFPVVGGAFNEPDDVEARAYLQHLKEHPEYEDCRVRVYIEVIAEASFPQQRPYYC